MENKKKFIVAVLTLSSFGYGFLSGVYQLPPYSIMKTVKVSYSDALGRNSLPKVEAPYFEGNAKAIILGNSLTVHAPATDLGWNGFYGMAASSKKADYVHQLLHILGINSELAYIRNMYPLEVDSSPIFEFKKQLENLFANSLNADVVVLQLGDNVRNRKGSTKELSISMNEIFNSIPKDIHSSVFCVSTYWGKSIVDNVIRDICEKYNSSFVYIGDIFPRQNLNIDKYEFHGVNIHPKDREMLMIAERIYGQIMSKKAGF
tara:strand:+ start:194 stop:976 length:783 start_codon:yes stop_codon:yes gene_type:complete